MGIKLWWFTNFNLVKMRNRRCNQWHSYFFPLGTWKQCRTCCCCFPSANVLGSNIPSQNPNNIATSFLLYCMTWATAIAVIKWAEHLLKLQTDFTKIWRVCLLLLIFFSHVRKEQSRPILPFLTPLNHSLFQFIQFFSIQIFATVWISKKHT